MLIGNNELITAPVRNIDAKVEVLITSTDARTGTKAVRIDGCMPGSTLNVQLQNGNFDYASMKIAMIGKNLFDASKYELVGKYVLNGGGTTTSTAYKCVEAFIPVSHLQGKIITLNHPVAEVSTTTNARAFNFYTDADASTVIAGSATRTGTVEVPATANYMRITVPVAYTIGDIQIELGETVTDFEAYKEPIYIDPSDEGVVDITANYNTTTIYISEDGGNADTEITVSYAIESAGDTFKCVDRLASITIDRMGESKFFGFGICQKANIKVIDVERNYSFTTNDKFNIYFDDVCVSPQMRVSEVHRDENNNQLSITTYDVLKKAEDITVAELELSDPYTIGDLAAAIAAKLKVSAVIPELAEFNISYVKPIPDEDVEPIASFDGAESLREVLNAIAEATQTIYYVNSRNELIFKRLDMAGVPDYTIDKEQYITLKTKDNRRLTAICSATELGDNYVADTGLPGTTQYVRNNPLWELRKDIETLVDNAVATVGNMTIGQFDCSWRGNYLIEPGDKLALITKDNSETYSYLTNDSIFYDGSYSQTTTWEYVDAEAEHANPTSLGEALKQTYAKVDKANKEIEIVVKKTDANAASISQLLLDTESITASVSSVQEALVDTVDGINQELVDITNKVSATMTSEEVKIEIQTEMAKGASSISTSTQGYTFDDNGLNISRSDSDISTVITEDGLTVKQGSKDKLIANNEGVEAYDLKAKTYLVIGKYSRFQNYGSRKRTACYWIG